MSEPPPVCVEERRRDQEISGLHVCLRDTDGGRVEGRERCAHERADKGPDVEAAEVERSEEAAIAGLRAGVNRDQSA